MNDWIYSIWFRDGGYHQRLSYIEAQQLLFETGYSTKWVTDFLERVGTPDDLALEVGDVIGMNVTDFPDAS